ncbi:DUF6412 domain-containing protein [uncultured Leifsonia sp.]|uniref:DUF6412 domain-containing protein n=1 Tax=uncultured Leifsonia sp. TaxID=340359 RepID=UPI0025F0AFF4|nr:DUF6412 domain-containing protein [uncultured Leifsonia sp.]
MALLLELVARLTALGPSSVSGLVALAGLAGAIGIVAVVAAAAVRSVAALAASLRVRPVWSTPLQPTIGWLIESQADPDADGRPRPRAPGNLLPVA